ncbi:dual specificity protein kinase Ttk isoform X2 [Nelusetta ayraudi]|uniref:dual specificity protein kinase Ttk isoform X2 n=1 Tax=Nelusetta ayraudi TaxID=303726 RepID=UPI003F6FDC09
MEEEEHTDRKQQLAAIYQKLNKIKKSLDEDDSVNINQVISSNSPESCLAHLMELEKKWAPHQDEKHLARLLASYTRVFSSMPLGNHCENESYARILVRFAELKANQDINEAEANFSIARLHCQNFAFVHVAQAQFEHSQGNTKKAIYILQKAFELGAEPKEMLETTLQSMQAGKMNLSCLEDKENVPLSSNSNAYESAKKGSAFQKDGKTSDGSSDLQLSSIFVSGVEPHSGSFDDHLSKSRSGSQHKRAIGIQRRFPVKPFSIQENDDGDNNIDFKPIKQSLQTAFPRQTPAFSLNQGVPPSSSKRNAADVDLLPPAISPDREDQAPAESTTTLLYSRYTSRREDVTSNFDQVIVTKCPESCWAFLKKLEERGNPHTDALLLNKLKDFYSQVFCRMPIRQFSKNSSYARMLVRYAELRGIEDPDEAQDHFIVARSNCKGFAFVHIAYAQFEATQGNVVKATSILHKALTMNARPTHHLELAIRNLKAGEKRLVPTTEEEEEEEEDDDDEEEEKPSAAPMSASHCGENNELHPPARVPVCRLVEHPKLATKNSALDWKLPNRGSCHVSPEDKRTTPPDTRSVPQVQESLPSPPLRLPSRQNHQTVFQTPNNYGNPHGNSYITPVVKTVLEAPSSEVALHRAGPVQQPFTPMNQAPCFQTPQAPIPALSKDFITVKGKQFYILKMIGRGGSSKVYQVLDQQKQLFALKYVDLLEADDQSTESYKNEIKHLNHLQQHSDQIIKLYDYEITSSYIYMLMECGNLDLNRWLQKRSDVNPLERKLYWKNMLEAVQTIHKYGIVHRDLKPANFVIVNASLKLIDFGIANRIQPDVTSVMKDSPTGTINYMSPEVIRDTSSQSGKARSKISPKGDVWSLGCILYNMTYGRTPFQRITNQMAKMHAIIDPSHNIDFPEIDEKDLLDVLKKCLVRNPKERISIAELLEHPYLHLKPQASPEPERPCNSDLRKILTDLAALQSPNSIVRAANNLAKMCKSGRKLDVAECAKSSF